MLKEVGQRIRAARLAAGMTQAQAAAATGIDYKRWQDLEGGRVNATLRTLTRISAGLNITVWTLLDATPPTAESASRKRAHRQG